MKIFLLILSSIGLLAWGVCFALGYNYMEGGALSLSILLGVALLAVTGLLFYLMSRWSHPLAEDHKASAKSWEIISLAGYVLVMAISTQGVAQFITVQTSVQNEVKPIAEERLNELETVFGDAGTPGSYLSYVEEKSASLGLKVGAQYEGLDEKGRQDNIKLARSRFEDEMTGDGTFYNLQRDVESFIGHCRYSVRNWVPWTVIPYLSQLDSDLPKWEEEVTKMSTAHEWTVNEPYTVGSVASGNLVEAIQHPAGGVFSGFAILIMVVIQVIILISYLAGRNWNTSGPSSFKHGQFSTWDSSRR